MAEQKIIVVSELAPRLQGIETRAAQKFLKDYLAYENRLEAGEAQVLMRNCIDPVDLDILVQCSTDMKDIQVIRGLPAGANAERARRVQVGLVPITPRPLDLTPIPEEGKEVEVPVEVDFVPGGIPEVLYLSNAHVEHMLLHVLGPVDEIESLVALRLINMAKDPDFALIQVAVNYVRDWRDCLRWCRKFLPKEKVLVKYFLTKVFP